jgi:hypothetical protein
MIIRKCEIVIKPINNLIGVLSGITRHNIIYFLFRLLFTVKNKMAL